MNLQKFYKNKKILVTAGPTWVAIDQVRVMTSVFSGQTGLEIARHFANLGADVTLLLGPGSARLSKSDFEKMKVEHFCYYEELFSLIIGLISEEKYDVIIHSAAVSDYRPVEVFDGKIPSKKEVLRIDFKPTKKIIDYIWEQAKDSFIVRFKLQPDSKNLEKIAIETLRKSGGDLIVANSFEEIEKTTHKALIIDKKGNLKHADSKQKISEIIGEKIIEGSNS